MSVEPQLVEVVAKLDAHDNPMLGDAQIILDGGNTKVEMKKGRARVTPEVAAMLQGRADVEVLGYVQPPQAYVAVQVPVAPVAPRQATPGAGATPETIVESPEADRAALDAAKAHLAQEGMDAPDPIVLPEGFEMRTSEGEYRCIAKKSDGSQCSNAATDEASHACGIAKHRDAVANY